jgi:hypothetical protein
MILASCCGIETTPSPTELLVMGWFGIGCGVLLLAQALYVGFIVHRQRRAAWQWWLATISTVVGACALVLAQRAFTTYQQVGGMLLYSQESIVDKANHAFETPTLLVVIAALALLFIGVVRALADQ